MNSQPSCEQYDGELNMKNIFILFFLFLFQIIFIFLYCFDVWILKTNLKKVFFKIFEKEIF